MMLSDPKLLFVLIPVVLMAITVHEYAHGWVAFRCGDDTAYAAGRLTLNPLSHLDFLGALLFIIAGFGWAKPVPVNIHNLNQPRRDMILVAIAGPLSNILLAVIGMYAYYLAPSLLSYFSQEIKIVAYVFIFININFAIFNLLPIIPLDGSRIIQGLLSPARELKYLQMMRYAPFIMLFVIIIENMGILRKTLGFGIFDVLVSLPAKLLLQQLETLVAFTLKPLLG